MAGSLDSRRAHEWQRRMTRFEKARQSVAEFCRREGVSAPSFYQWRKALVRGSPGAKLTLEVSFHAGRGHLPIVTLKRAA